MEHTTLVGFSIMVIERHLRARHDFRRALEGAGAEVFLAEGNEDALRIIDEAVLSAAVVGTSRSAGGGDAIARRLSGLGIPHVLCAAADAAPACTPAPLLRRPIVDSELIALLHNLLQPSLETVGDRENFQPVAALGRQRHDHHLAIRFK